MLELVQADEEQFVLECLLNNDLLVTGPDDVDTSIDIVEQCQLDSLTAFKIDDHEEVENFIHFSICEGFNLDFTEQKHQYID